MSVIVPRTCTEISTSNVDQNREKNSRLLKEFRSASAYVLLGDPGSGKTTAFENESVGEVNTCLITARNFLSLDVNSHPEWRSKTLFIDGLDEVRVGATNPRTPLDRIRSRIDALGKPRFRLSCREADWPRGQRSKASVGCFAGFRCDGAASRCPDRFEPCPDLDGSPRRRRCSGIHRFSPRAGR